MKSSLKHIDTYEVISYTDGSCDKGIGGYGYLTIINGTLKKYCGFIENSTNNIAELTAIRQVLIKLESSPLLGKILIRTDSRYSINSITIWFYQWKKKNWKTSTGKTPENLELIKEIVELVEEKDVTFEYVKSHSGEKYNEMVDRLAKKGRLRAKIN
jgi:ribonuclease HI